MAFNTVKSLLTEKKSNFIDSSNSNNNKIIISNNVTKCWAIKDSRCLFHV